ncbi:hypothetical protein V8C86DRAFT_2727430 [Haematococcus lacustris]
MAATYAPSSSGTRVTLRVGNLPPYLTHEDFQRLWQSSDGWLGGRVLGSGHGVAEFSSLIAAQRAKSTYEGWTGFGAPLSLNVDAAPAAPQPSENFAYDPEMFGKLAQTRPGAVGDVAGSSQRTGRDEGVPDCCMLAFLYPSSSAGFSASPGASVRPVASVHSTAAQPGSGCVYSRLRPFSSSPAHVTRGFMEHLQASRTSFSNAERCL